MHTDLDLLYFLPLRTADSEAGLTYEILACGASPWFRVSRECILLYRCGSPVVGCKKFATTECKGASSWSLPNDERYMTDGAFLQQRSIGQLAVILPLNVGPVTNNAEHLA